MPKRSKRPCGHPGCGQLTDGARCATHAAAKRQHGWRRDAERGNRHERGYGTAWEHLRGRILRRDNYLCHCDECKRLGRIRPATEVDHRIPKEAGGTDDPSNLQAINRDCHKAKTIKDRK